MSLTWGIDPDALMAQITDSAQAGLFEVAQKTLELATKYVPVQTGALRDSGVVLNDAETTEPTAYVAYTQPYAAEAEFGLGARAPHPYLTRAVGELEASYEKIFADAFQANMSGKGPSGVAGSP